MRDPRRIPAILHKLREVWERYPDLRLAQLVNNCSESRDAYYIEDEEIVFLLEKTYPSNVSLE